MFLMSEYVVYVLISIILVVILLTVLILCRKKFNFKDIPDQSGKIIIVTGSTSGIGYETAKELAKKNAHVILAARNPKKAQTAIENIKKEYEKASLEFMQLDTSSLESVKEFAKNFAQSNRQIDALVLNAGIYKVPKREVSVDGNERQLATNYLGHFVLTGLLLPFIKNSEESRIVSVSSLSHSWTKIDQEDLNLEKSYKPTKAYAQSKLALLMFSYELARKLNEKDLKIKSIAVHPGIAVTGITRFGDTSKKLTQKIWNLGFMIVGQSQKKGSLPTLYGVTSNEVISGAYYGPDMLFGSKGYPVKVSSSRYSKNINEAKKLWEKTEKITGFKYDF